MFSSVVRKDSKTTMSPVVTKNFNCERCSSCENCNKEETYICTCIKNPDNQQVSELSQPSQETEMTGEKIQVPDGFVFRKCIECHLAPLRLDPEESAVCKRCQAHQAFICTCEEALPINCNLCIQVRYFKTWPRSWRHFHERKIPQYEFILCDDCVCRRYMNRYKGKSFTPCDNCQQGLIGTCPKDDCKSCPHCDQHDDYLRLIEGLEYGPPF